MLEAMTNLNKEQGVSILMVTHDAYSASYCDRILFIRDGKIFNELKKESNQDNFYKEILDVVANMDTSIK